MCELRKPPTDITEDEDVFWKVVNRVIIVGTMKPESSSALMRRRSQLGLEPDLDNSTDSDKSKTEDG